MRRLYAQMLSSFTEKDKSFKFRLKAASLGVAIWLSVTFIAYIFLDTIGILLSFALPLFVAGIFFLGIIQRLDELSSKQISDERSTQALMGIYRSLNPRKPLPYFRNAAISSDTAREYIRLIEQLQPETIVELGSGTSTVVAAYQLEKNGKGRVIALDHDKIWGGITSGWLEDHGLSRYADIRIAPLVQVESEGISYEWYNPDSLKDIEHIDILLIDGPPDYYGLGLRYPALPLCASRLGDNSVIVVDDCVMPYWKKIVVGWASDNGFSVESLFLNEKDTLFLRRDKLRRG